LAFSLHIQTKKTLNLLNHKISMHSYRKWIMGGLVLMALCFVPFDSIAQVVDPGCNPDDPACPIDGGLSLLIAAGIGLGAKKAYDRKKQKEQEEPGSLDS
jgi:hypothetical protein